MRRWLVLGMLVGLVLVNWGGRLHAATVRSSSGASRQVTELASDWHFAKGEAARERAAGLGDCAAVRQEQ